MHSSTSSFETPIPRLRWIRIWGIALCIFIAIFAAMEIDLRWLGYRPTIIDTPDRWIAERVRAKELGKRGLIWIGASRGQLGIDIDTLRTKTGLEPVQLAIDGCSFIPVLKGLADDPTITGTVIVDYQPDSIDAFDSKDFGASDVWETRYEKAQLQAHSVLALKQVEKLLAAYPREHLASYADDSDPLQSLQFRILTGEKPNQYLVTYPNRSRAANYKIAPMPATYLRRAARNMGMEGKIDPNSSTAERQLREKLASLRPRDTAAFLSGTNYVAQLVAKIEARGGKVLFVEMPTSGLVREAEDKFYPRTQFLEAFEHITGKAVLVSNEAPKLKDFICPDGSHLDMSDRTPFTSAMVDALGLAKRTQ